MSKSINRLLAPLVGYASVTAACSLSPPEAPIVDQRTQSKAALIACITDPQNIRLEDQFTQGISTQDYYNFYDINHATSGDITFRTTCKIGEKRQELIVICHDGKFIQGDVPMFLRQDIGATFGG